MGRVAKPFVLVKETNVARTTLGPAYNEFGYNEHPAITSNFFSQKKSLLIDINVKKVHLQRVPLITSKVLSKKLLVVSGAQCSWKVCKIMIL